MSSTGNITEGHRLFTEWACSIANEEGKPSCTTMKNVLHYMNVYGVAIEGYKIRKTHQGLWPYLVHSKVPCCPPKAVRRCIEYVSRNQVPVESWDNVLYNIGRKEKA